MLGIFYGKNICIFHTLSAYKWGMEKLIITCNAEYLSYVFPKRKWYQLIKPDRIALMRLDYAGEDNLMADILLQILENTQETFSYELHSIYRNELYEAVLGNYRQFYEKMEHVLIWDLGDECFPELAYKLAANRNYLTIFTRDISRYENVLEKIEQEHGLVGMVFTEYGQMKRYLKTIPATAGVFVVAGNGKEDGGETDNKECFSKNKWNVLYQLPKKSFLMDFSEDEFLCSHIFKKRMHFTYVNIPIFLDNTVKNRYNAVVNEGITFQVMNKKTFRRRKGNKDGRKEEYSDL